MTGGHAAPTLVILAAGLGSRYGDAKQIAGIGPAGEWLLEYAVHDALAAGFTQVVMAIRAELAAPLTARLAAHLHGRATLQLIEQTIDKVPSGCRQPANRQKPLGTGHALWCCAPLLHGPFAVINADDYYGRAAFRLLADHFARGAGSAMVGYRLDATLSSHGGVNRGVCRIDSGGYLRDVTEYLDIRAHAAALEGTAPDGTRRALARDTLVSLNCWGLTPELLPDLELGLREFLVRAGEKDEYFLPHAITRHVAVHGPPLSVLRTPDAWMGLTYPDDRAQVAAAVAALHARGAYPTPLWPAA